MGSTRVPNRIIRRDGSKDVADAQKSHSLPGCIHVARANTPDKQDAYATLLAPRSCVANAKSSIGYQFVLAAPSPSDSSQR
jgi:hypothetical protein